LRSAHLRSLSARVAPLCAPLILAATALAQTQGLPAVTERQILALLAEKAARNPAQMKMDSHLVHAAAILRGQPVSPDFPTPPGELESVRLDSRNFVEVDIRADIGPDLLGFIDGLGGAVLGGFPERQTLRARLPLLSVERVAQRDDVREIRLAARASVNSSEGPDSVGDIAHQANAARSNFNVNGAGVKVGVISDGVNSLASEVTKGNLPSNVTTLAGQAGSGDEGTAMLEIVYTLAPGASLYFATGTSGEGQMAANIQALANAGCSIIVDDITYFSEGAFQDDTVAKAVDTVTASGVFYFVAAGNNGNALFSSSGTWEGDFVDSGTTITDKSVSVAVHSFGSANYDTLTLTSQALISGGGEGVYELMWSDPLGASANDYDLFITDSSGNVIASSTNVQNGAQNPEEDITDNTAVSSGCSSGTCRILIVKHSTAATRALFLSTERGTLSIGTKGATYGHAAAAAAFGIAATNGENGDPVYRSNCTGFSSTCNAGIESFSSDGPRQMFYNSNGSAITPGNVLFGTSGGASLAKPDFTAADDVGTGVSEYATFAGTSAAAPHAAAIAALLLQAVPGLTASTMRAALSSSAIAIDGAAPNIDAGEGIVMAPAALLAACAYSMTAPSSIPGAAGGVTVGIQAGANCPWTISGMPTWLSGTASGTGPASLTLTASANTGSARAATLALMAGTLATGATASITQPVAVNYSISGAVTLYGSALAGVTMTLSGSQSATVTTSATGYSFTAAQGGSYTVTPALAHYMFTPASQTVTNLSAAATLNFAAAATYLVGDVAPYASDVAPNFGDGSLDIQDLIQELFAVNAIPSFTPTKCSDRFDAMDGYPEDTSSARGGDGLLDIRDLIVELFRVNNLDTSRPVRASRGGTCAGGSSAGSSNATQSARRLPAQPARRETPEAALRLGHPEKLGAGQARISVYLEALRSLAGVALTFALGDGRSQLALVPGTQAPPSLSQDTRPGVVAAAWLGGLSLPVGQEMLLGYVTGPAGALANLRFYGASASGLGDNRPIGLDLPASSGPGR
jgi:subtilisin family serine protease